ncbi:hypothetical protein IC230_19545 [Spirosoma sp. BT704]|uniref:Lipocalin-like domain-containing protein n=1 Tax=Spirosoma validum TaxID=2771355 RepID=A0A927B3T1_9BACT|nr:hypothetical protein [Spirosoma validum]
MNSFRIMLITSLFLCVLTSCKKDDNSANPTPTEATQTDLLVANSWHTTSITTTDGQEINKSRLDLFSQSLFTLNMQFRNNGRVNALDPLQANSVINGGTWKLAADNKSIDVDVTGFQGNFPIVQLTKSRLILRQDNKASVDGKKTDIYMVFDPVL